MINKQKRGRIVMKKSVLAGFFVILVLLSLSSVFGATYTINQQIIDIKINTQGNAIITEEFNLFFPTERDKINFRESSTTLGSDLEKWKQYNPQFSPSIGLNNIINGKISYTEGAENILTINYTLSDSLMALGKETTMMSEYQLKANYWNKFYQSGIWIIPDKTEIRIDLPPGADIKDNVEPAAIITTLGSRKSITWQGYKSANRITLNYVLWKKVTPVVDLNSITSYLFKTTEGLVLIFIAAIIFFAILWKRKTIIKKLEDFVETNSKIEEE